MGYRAREIRTCMMCTMSCRAYVCRVPDRSATWIYARCVLCMENNPSCLQCNVRLYMHLQSKYRLCCTAWWHIYGVYYFHVLAKKSTSLSDYRRHSNLPMSESGRSPLRPNSPDVIITTIFVAPCAMIIVEHCQRQVASLMPQ